MSKFRLVILSAGLGLLVSTGAIAQQGAPTVSVVKAEKRPVTDAASFVGRVEPVQRVDLRARVTGFLESVQFKDGDRVKAGAPLYGIEKAPFEAALQQAQANVDRARAQAENATLQLRRAQDLVRTNAGTVATRDDRAAAEKIALGDVAAAEAQQKTAEINLGYTNITAPIDGRIGRTAVTPGNVVGPDSGVLATIVSSDPIYVAFPVSQRDFLRLAEARKQRQSAATPDYDVFTVTVRFSDGTVYPERGKINFVDVKVDRATDTILVRATIANPDGELVDGQLVQVSVEGDKPEERVVIPQVALIADQQGPYVFIVDGGKAVVRRLTLGPNVGASVVVTDGLKGGELVVIDGLQSLRPGAPVTAAPASKPLGG